MLAGHGQRSRTCDMWSLCSPVQEERLYPSLHLPSHLQNRWLCRHQGEWCHPQGYASQVLPWTHWCRLERHETSDWRRDEQTGRTRCFLLSISCISICFALFCFISFIVGMNARVVILCFRGPFHANASYDYTNIQFNLLFFFLSRHFKWLPILV